MQRKPADVIADQYMIGPSPVFFVDGNNNNAIGQNTMAISIPVVLASDQTPKTTSTATKKQYCSISL